MKLGEIESVGLNEISDQQAEACFKAAAIYLRNIKRVVDAAHKGSAPHAARQALFSVAIANAVSQGLALNGAAAVGEMEYTPENMMALIGFVMDALAGTASGAAQALNIGAFDEMSDEMRRLFIAAFDATTLALTVYQTGVAGSC